jgi:hypothetical protein
MRRIKFLGLAAVVLVAALGVLAATASAEPAPTWFECAKGAKNGEKKYTGSYTDKLCEHKATAEEITAGKSNKYELKEGLGKKKGFKAKSATPKFEVSTPYGKFPIKCGSSATAGTPALPNLVSGVSVVMKKCEFLEQKCTSPGAKAGELKASGLVGELGTLKPESAGAGPAPAVGLKIEAPGGEKEAITKFECGEKKYVVAELFGAVIGVQTGNVNHVSKESALTFTYGGYYGEHEFGGKKYTPFVNPLGWESELAEIEACSGLACSETEHPAHVLRGVYCGTFVESELGAECTPPTYTGLEAKEVVKGEGLEIKA